jgi:hypothetical protein
MAAIALVADRTDSDLSPERRRSEDLLASALSDLGATVHRFRWHEESGAAEGVDLVVIREVALDPTRRESFLGWARTVAEATPVWNPVEVLRWGSHRSFLLELEERGVPLVPTAWLARGDTFDLDALLRHRGWARARIASAVAGAAGGQATPGSGACGVAAGQGALDRLLGVDDVLVQGLPSARDQTATTSCLVIDGRASHLVHAGDGEVEDAEAAALAEWVVDATGVPLLAARVDLVRDPVGTLQVVDLEVVAPDLALAGSPVAAATAAEAILRRLPG